MTQRQFAKSRGVSEKTIYTWKQDGFLIFEDGKINVEQSNARIDELHPTKGIPVRSDESSNLSDLKKEKLALEIKIARLDRDLRTGKLLLIEKEIEGVALETNTLRHRVLSLGARLAPSLSGRSLSAAQVQTKIGEEIESFLSELTYPQRLRAKAIKAGSDECDYFWDDIEAIDAAKDAEASKEPATLADLKADKLRGDIADLRDKYIKKWETLIPAQAMADDAEACDRLLFKVWRTLGKRVAPQLANTIQNPGRITQIIVFEVNEILKSISEGNALDPDAQPKRKTR